MNDEQLMNQIIKLVVSLNEIKDVRNTQPYSFHNLFMAICRYIDQLKLDETKLNYVEKLKAIFLDFQSNWIDMQTYWNPKQDVLFKKEIFSNLEKYLANFDKIIDRRIERDSLKADLDNLDETRKTNRKARRANIIAFVALCIAITSVVVTLILYFRF